MKAYQEIISTIKMLISKMNIPEVYEGTVQSAASNYARVALDGAPSTVRVEVQKNAVPAVNERALVVRLPRTSRWVMIGSFRGKTAGQTTVMGEATIAPPNNVAASGHAGIIEVTWDYPVMRDVIFEVQINDTGAENGSETSIAHTKSCQLLVWPGDTDTHYLRVRSISHERNFSGWSDWVSAAADAEGGGGSGTPGDTVEDETSYGLTPDAGVATEYSRADHTHGSVGHDDHANLTNVTADQHHARSHDHSNASDGSTITPGILNIPTSAAPAQTAEGQAIWDSDDDVLTIGDGTSRQIIGVLGSSSPEDIGTAASGSSLETSRADHVHEASLDNLSDVVVAGAAKGDILTHDGTDWANVNITDESIPARTGAGDIAPIAMSASTILARLASGSIVAATVSQIKTLLALAVTDVTNAANTALSNLASVAVNTTIASDTDNTDDLGTTSIFWRNIFSYLFTAKEGSAPSTPASGIGIIYATASHVLRWLTSLGQDTLVHQGEFDGYTAYNGTNLETVVGQVTIKGGTLNTGGGQRLIGWGNVSNSKGSNGTATIRIRIGGLSGTIVATSGALTVNNNGNLGWELNWDMHQRNNAAVQYNLPRLFYTISNSTTMSAITGLIMSLNQSSVNWASDQLVVVTIELSASSAAFGAEAVVITDGPYCA